MHFILSGPHTSLHICNHIHYKKIATYFSKNEGGGSKAVWNFSKNSSDLVAGPFPKCVLAYWCFFLRQFYACAPSAFDNVFSSSNHLQLQKVKTVFDYSK